MFEDSKLPVMPGDGLKKPNEGDILILRNMPDIQISERERRVVVSQVWDSLAESWDPVGEAAWTQHDVNEVVGYKGRWYAYVNVPGNDSECWSVASYEVAAIERKR